MINEKNFNNYIIIQLASSTDKTKMIDCIIDIQGIEFIINDSMAIDIINLQKENERLKKYISNLMDKLKK